MTQYLIPPLVTILGPTASGKTKLAVDLAEHLNGEIISADSRQVYRYMDLGTGKDIEEYGSIKHHLIDIVSPQDEYNLFNFVSDFCRIFPSITNRRKLPFLVGGTGMYLDSILNRYNLTIANIDKNTRQDLEIKTEVELANILTELKPFQHNTTDCLQKDRLIRAIEIAYAEKTKHSNQVVWPEFEELILGIRVPREQLKVKIKTRLKSRFQLGMIEEVENLLKIGVSRERIDNFGLEYRYILKHIKGELNFNDMFQKLNSAILNFSKQQEKWFRNMEKKGKKIIWLDADESINLQALNIIKEHNTHKYII
jgi:tRNA dimethylallyltransferase